MTTKEEKIQQLWQLYESVRDTVDDYETILQGIRTSKPVKLDDALEFAERIAPSSFAPPGWMEGFPLLNAFPPAPQGEQMRIGKLAEYNREIEQKIKNQELLPPSDTSSSLQKSPSEQLRQESIEEARQKTLSLQERLRLRKAKMESQQSAEAKMEVEESSASPPPIEPSIEEEQEQERIDLTPEPYIPVKARQINLSFAPVEESESEEEEEDD